MIEKNKKSSEVLSSYAKLKFLGLILYNSFTIIGLLTTSALELINENMKDS